MKSLLWKDYRNNRLLLIFGFVVCVGPWVITIARYTHQSWWGGQPWVTTFVISMGLSLVTFAMLGGNAIAAERADRSSEFLAYMPVSRWTILKSKSLIALPPLTLIWMVNLVFLFLIAPLLAGSEGVSSADMVRQPEVREMLGVLAATSVLLLGAGWFWSAVLSSHGLATGMSFFVLAVVVMGMIGVEYGLGVEVFDTSRTITVVSLVVGIGGYLAGCAYYLHRLEP